MDEVYNFQCEIINERYYNDETFWGVFTGVVENQLPHSELFSFFDDDSKPNYLINLAGKMQKLYLGCKYDMKCTLEFNKKYNSWQYCPKKIKAIKPTTMDDNKAFLNSILTTKQTEVLLNAYPDFINIIIEGRENEINLNNTRGIKEATFNKIKQKVLDNFGMSELLIMLQPLGITVNAIKKIQTLDDNPEIIKQKIIDNPYILTNIKGLGFQKVDSIALRINPDKRISIERLTAFIKYYFEKLGNEDGDTLVKLSTLSTEIDNKIPDCNEIYKNFINNETQTSKLLYIKDDCVGLKIYKDNEFNIINILKNINAHNIDYSLEINYNDILKETESELGFAYTKEQREAIISTLNHGVTIITANAGTGKSTCIKGIINLYKNKCLSLCSLSAKASRRMTEVSGYEAFTIHKLLGFGKSEDKEKPFEYDETNLLPTDVLVIDEASMINVNLFLALLKALKPTSKVIIVFDSDQLPPIGCGNVATDLLKSNLNIKKLTIFHRQALNSGILTDANKVRQQEFPIEKPVLKEVHGVYQDMCYMFRNDREHIRNIIVNSYIKNINEYGIENCIIIVPRKKGCINSTLEINKIIQDKLILPDTKSIDRGDSKFYIGARIINKVNDSEKGVINGQFGYITDIYKDNVTDKMLIKVKFDDLSYEVIYKRDELLNIELGYACTTHSYQGNESKVVIIGLDNTHYRLLSNNMLYTAITRAKKKCLLVCEPSAFKICINTKKNYRKTWLRKFFFA